jgi:hypothetical protein
MTPKHPSLLQDCWHFIAMLLGTGIAILYLSVKYGDHQINFEDANVMGAETSEIKYSMNEHKIHCGDSRDADECIAGLQQTPHHKIALWLGNSQLHAVNQLRPNQLNAPPIAFKLLDNERIYLIAFSQPNANLQEHFLTYLYLNQQRKISHLILPVVFDDFREDGIRPELLKFANDPQIQEKLSKSLIGKKINKEGELSANKNNTDTAALDGTIQDKVELSLNDWFDRHFGFWQARADARGTLFTQLYLTRNTILGINPSSKRKVIKGRYQDNMDALKAMLELAKENSSHVLVYIAPLRSDVEIPYIKSEYDSFKNEVQILAKEQHAQFVNFEDLVPADLWGSKGGTTLGEKTELDFMHFQAGGHSLLANEVVKHLIQPKRVAP